MKYTIFIMGMLLSLPALASAAGLRAEPSSIRPGELAHISVILDTAGEGVNAIEGTLKIPGGAEASGVNDGNSLVSFWLEHPALSGNSIRFAGVLAGGFSGQGPLFNFDLRAKDKGTLNLALENIRLYENNGEGSFISINSSSISIAVSDTAVSATSTPDTDPPESFLPEIARDQAIFDGRYFLAFDATDKGSGMDYFEILEVPRTPWRSLTGNWQRTDSPYLLKDQNLQSDVYVRAVDRAGNFRIVKIPARASNQQWTYIVLLLVLICLVVVWRRYAHHPHEA